MADVKGCLKQELIFANWNIGVYGRDQRVAIRLGFHSECRGEPGKLSSGMTLPHPETIQGGPQSSMLKGCARYLGYLFGASWSDGGPQWDGVPIILWRGKLPHYFGGWRYR